MELILKTEVRGSLIAEQFSGSSTSLAMLQHWINTGDLRKSGITTNDIKFAAPITIDEKEMTINPGDYVVKAASNMFFIVPESSIKDLYMQVKPID